MHEMSLALNILEMALKEAQKKGCGKLLHIKVEYGALSGVLEEALEFCLHALLANTIHAQARVELVKKPLKLYCSICGANFNGQDKFALWMPCPDCGEILGREILEGRELILSQIEACKE